MAIHTLFSSLALTLVLGATPAFAQSSDSRVGIVRLQDALTGCREGKAARKKLEAAFRGSQNQLRNKEAKLKKRYESLAPQAAKAGGDQSAVQADLLAFQKDVQAAQQLRAKLQTDLAQSEAELTKKILEKMRPLIARIARKDGYTVILNADQVLYSPTDLDITDKLIRLYDKENP